MKTSLGLLLEGIIDRYTSDCSGLVQILGEVMALITQPETYLGIDIVPVMIFKADGLVVIVHSVMAQFAMIRAWSFLEVVPGLTVFTG